VEINDEMEFEIRRFKVDIRRKIRFDGKELVSVFKKMSVKMIEKYFCKKRVWPKNYGEFLQVIVVEGLNRKFFDAIVKEKDIVWMKVEIWIGDFKNRMIPEVVVLRRGCMNERFLSRYGFEDKVGEKILEERLMYYGFEYDKNYNIWEISF
jgi:hypothetical protein